MCLISSEFVVGTSIIQALTLGNIPFEDVRLSGEEFATRKAGRCKLIIIMTILKRSPKSHLSQCIHLKPLLQLVPSLLVNCQCWRWMVARLHNHRLSSGTIQQVLMY